MKHSSKSGWEQKPSTPSEMPVLESDLTSKCDSCKFRFSLPMWVDFTPSIGCASEKITETPHTKFMIYVKNRHTAWEKCQGKQYEKGNQLHRQ